MPVVMTKIFGVLVAVCFAIAMLWLLSVPFGWIEDWAEWMDVQR